jgi:hypothetical protein
MPSYRKNDSLDFVELEMKVGGFLDFAFELKNPDFAAREG